MYVAVKGGEKAIANAHELLAQKRRGDPVVPELSLAQISEQLGLAVDRVMAEASLYDKELAALAIKQAQGDLIEAIFLLRAYRTTLPRLGISEPIDTSTIRLQRRISAIFKDLPGGQILGPTYDYTHRLLDFSLCGTGSGRELKPIECPEECQRAFSEEITGIVALLRREGLLETEEYAIEDEHVGDLTRQPIRFPAQRDIRLQNLARGDEGFLHALAYSGIRGFGLSAHPFVGELRVGKAAVEIVPEELGFPVEIGEIAVTECYMVHSKKGLRTTAPGFGLGYGLVFGHCERKSMAMSLLDITLRIPEEGEKPNSPAQDEEFVLYHSDNVEASGFVQHLKLPHYVDFQAELVWVRGMRESLQWISEVGCQRSEAGTR
jgi:alpha-D-ribose 1-methylphosphonate 5-triphosphate synthase subunit PhnI